MFADELEFDFAYSLGDDRFRVNLHWERGNIGLAARYIPKDIPTLDSTDIEPAIRNLIDLKQGLILLTGPTGCGKSTTLAAMIDGINKKYKKHIITLEDPIEFSFRRINSVIEQREVSRDTRSFDDGLKRVLRQDPNVILIGEMRDLETISVALTAAETGHLVLSTLHTSSAAETIERIIDMFETDRQKQVLVQLASSLRAVISQRLLPKANGAGMVVAREILINNPAVSNLIRQNKVNQINSVIQTSSKDGMITLEKSIQNMYNKKLIDKQTYDAWNYDAKFSKVAAS